MLQICRTCFERALVVRSSFGQLARVKGMLLVPSIAKVLVHMHFQPKMISLHFKRKLCKLSW